MTPKEYELCDSFDSRTRETHLRRLVQYGFVIFAALTGSFPLLKTEAQLHMTISLLLGENETEQALRAATLALTHSKDQREEVQKLIVDFPVLMEDEVFRSIHDMIQGGEALWLY